MAEAIVGRFAGLDSCAVADALGALGLRGATFGVAPMWPAPRLVGRAVTMAVKPAGRSASERHLGVAAIDRAARGAVLLTARGRLQGASVGEEIVFAGASVRRARLGADAAARRRLTGTGATRAPRPTRFCDAVVRDCPPR
jgi:regulator of RNase E activity RraA